ncbi:MAG: hypothetical protein ACJAUP_001743 [Cellvibrionaceae bacterium]|jgi:hypothetical protein
MGIAMARISLFFHEHKIKKELDITMQCATEALNPVVDERFVLRCIVGVNNASPSGESPRMYQFAPKYCMNNAIVIALNLAISFLRKRLTF